MCRQQAAGGGAQPPLGWAGTPAAEHALSSRSTLADTSCTSPRPPPPTKPLVSIRFDEMSLGAALWTGLLAGFAYSIMVRLMYRQHFYAMRRLAEQQAAARREAEGGGALPGAGPVPHPIVIAV